MIIKLYLAVGLAMTVSAMCSLIEAALYSVSTGQIEVMVQSGKRSGRILKKMKAEIHKPITAILTLNTIANTMGAAVAGAAAVAVFGEQSLGWFSVIFTLLILIFSEIVPKTAGVAYARGLAPWIALPLHWLVILLMPIIILCQAITRVIPRHTGDRLVSAEEVRAIAALSRKSGEIEHEQEKVIVNILELQNKNVRRVMTPRTVTFSLSEDLTIAEAREMQDRWQLHSRAPVYDKDPDDVVGIVLRKDVFLDKSAEQQKRKMSSIMQPVHFVPEAAPLHRVLVEFFERRQHLFVVVDEYGSVTGVISLEDILEEIVGREIIDESDISSNLRELARTKRKQMMSRKEQQ